MTISPAIIRAMPRVIRHGVLVTVAAVLGATSAHAIIYPQIIPQSEMNNPALAEAVTGVICVYSGGRVISIGSGSVIGHSKVLLTAAHMGMLNGQWLPAGNLRFTARNHTAAMPSSGIFLRGYYKYDNYSAAVKAYTNRSNAAYTWDMLAGYAYQNLARGYAAGFWNTGADTVLKDYNYWKKLTGYPFERTQNYYMYRTPFFQGSFRQVYGAYYMIDGAVSYGGNSGGPLWVWHPATRNWYVAGVFVSSNRISDMRVRVLDANGVALLNAAKRAVGG